MDIKRRSSGMAAILVGVGVALWFCAGAAPASGGKPKQELKGTIDQVLEVLRDPAYQGDENKGVRREKLRELIHPRFDFAEMGKRSLARYWRKRTPAERKEFVDLFASLLEYSYISKIEAYSKEKIIYHIEREEGEFAEVKTKVVPLSGRDIPIDYRFHKTPEGWRVYDVVIEGVSLVSNYRTQFRRIIRKDSYAELIKRMKNKQQEIEEDVSGTDKKS